MDWWKIYIDSSRVLRSILKAALALTLIAYLASMSLSLLGVNVLGISEDSSVGDDRLDIERTEVLVHHYINEERREAGLKALEYDPRLVSIAANHSEDMRIRNYFSHTEPDGNNTEDRYEEARYECRIAVDGGVITSGGENLAMTHYDTEIEMPNGETEIYENESELARGIVDSWMNSSEHRENIMQPYWNHEGIGIARANDTVYATQNFC